MSYPLGFSLVIGSLKWVVEPDILGSILTLGVSLDYLIHGFGGWGHVSMVYSLRVGQKGPTLVRFHVIKIYFII